MVQLVQRKLLYTRGRADGLQVLRLRWWPAAVLFLRLRLDVVGEPCLRKLSVRWLSIADEGAFKLTRPSKIPVPSVATLGATYHSLSFNLVSCSA